MMLGFLESFEFQEKEITLHPGDCIVVYSDGITEATNCDGEQFEEDGLIRLIQNHRDDTAEDLIGAILQDVELFADGAPQSDDRTLVVVKRIR